MAQIIKEVELPPTLEAVVSYSDNFIKQSSSKWWGQKRYLRPTASNFGRKGYPMQIQLCQVGQRITIFQVI